MNISMDNNIQFIVRHRIPTFLVAKKYCILILRKNSIELVPYKFKEEYKEFFKLHISMQYAAGFSLKLHKKFP